MLMKPISPLKVDDDFHLSCVSSGAMEPRFSWTKDEKFRINTTLANRYISFGQHYELGGKSEITETLTIFGTLAIDSGTFRCTVEDDALLGLGELLITYRALPPRMIVSVEESVLVASPPNIEVFPQALTIMRGEQDESLRSLHCLAAKQSSFDHIANYSFSWLRDGRPLNWGEHGDFQEDLWLLSDHNGNGGIVFGAVLKIGRVEAQARFTCEVTDLRMERKVGSTARVDVDVFMAEGEHDVCRAGGGWPMTKKGTSSLRPCSQLHSGQHGMLRHKCESAGAGSSGRWNEYYNHKDHEQCVKGELLDIQTAISYYMAGYLRSTQNESIPVQFFQRAMHHLERDSYGLREKEWGIMMNITRTILEYIPGKIVDPSLSKDFFNSFVLDLYRSADAIASSSPLHQTPSKAHRPFTELFRLLEKGSRVFSAQLKPDSEEEFGQNCEDTFHVRLLKRITPFKEDHVRPAKQEIPCPPPPISVTLATNHSAAVVIHASVILFKKRDQPFYNQTYKNKSQTAIRTLGLSSSLVTVHFGEENARGIYASERKGSIPVAVTMRFNQFSPPPLPHPTLRAVEDSPIEPVAPAYKCARLKEDSNAALPWLVSPEDCTLRWDRRPGGVPDCTCASPGTYALLWQQVELEITLENVTGATMVIPLGCGGAITLLILTAVLLLGRNTNYCEDRRRPGADTMTKVTLCAAVAVQMALLIVLDLSEEDNNKLPRWFNPTLQILLLSTHCLQLAAALFCHHASYQPLVTGIGLAASVGLPTIYCGLLVYLRAVGSVLPYHWFPRLGTCEFYVLMLSLLILDLLFAMAFMSTRRSKKASNARKLEENKGRVRPFHHLYVSLALFVFTVTLFCCANTVKSRDSDLCLAAASLILGLVVFLCYFIASPLDSSFLSSCNSNVNSTRRSLDTACRKSLLSRDGSNPNSAHEIDFGAVGRPSSSLRSAEFETYHRGSLGSSTIPLFGAKTSSPSAMMEKSNRGEGSRDNSGTSVLNFGRESVSRPCSCHESNAAERVCFSGTISVSSCGDRRLHCNPVATADTKVEVHPAEPQPLKEVISRAMADAVVSGLESSRLCRSRSPKHGCGLHFDTSESNSRRSTGESKTSTSLIPTTTSRDSNDNIPFSNDNLYVPMLKVPELPKIYSCTSFPVPAASSASSSNSSLNDDAASPRQKKRRSAGRSGRQIFSPYSTETLLRQARDQMSKQRHLAGGKVKSGWRKTSVGDSAEPSSSDSTEGVSSLPSTPPNSIVLKRIVLQESPSAASIPTVRSLPDKMNR